MDTPASLLERLHQPEAVEAWTRFVDLYTPLLYSWARHLGLQDADAGDLVQEVLVVLYQKLPTFNYDPTRSFHAWLNVVLVNKWHEMNRRRPFPLSVPPDEVDSRLLVDPIPELDNAEYRRHLVGRALELMQTNFPERAWKACLEMVVHDRPAAELAAELGVSREAIYVTQFRMMRWLRCELAGLLD